MDSDSSTLRRHHSTGVSEEERQRRLAQCYRIILACAREAETKAATGETLDGDAPVAAGTCPCEQASDTQDTTT